MAQHEQDEDVVERLNRLEFLLGWLLLNGPAQSAKTNRVLLWELIREHPRYGASPSSQFLRDLSKGIVPDEDARDELEQEVGRLRGSVEHTAAMFKSVDAQLGSLDQQNAELRQQLRTLQGDLSPWLSVMSLGIEASQIPLVRYLPIRIYADGADYSDLIKAKRSLPVLLEAIGFTVAHELPDRMGSIFSKAWAKTQQVASEPEVAQRLEKLERALQLQGLDKPQAEVDALYLNAAAAFLKATENIPTVATQVGPLLVLKVTNSDGAMVQVMKLSTNQLIALEKNQSWLSSPADILAKLDGACDTTGSIYKPVFDGAALSKGISSNGKHSAIDTDEDEPPLGLPPPE